MYLEALEMTDTVGYLQYEISNISRPGKRCRHNLKYWRDSQWMGFGCGAHSTRNGARWRNVSETVRYIEDVTSGRSVVVDRRTLGSSERLGDALFMGIRLTDGLDIDGIRHRYGVDVLGKYGPELEPFIEAGLLVHQAGRLRLTRQGMLVSNNGIME